MQTDYLGIGTIGSVKEIADRLEARKILLVTGKHSFTTCGAEAVLYRDLAPLDIKRFSDFDVNPRLEDGYGGITLLQSFRPDLVIGVGGGSVIDMAKLITTLTAQPHDDYETIVKESIITAKGVPLAAIPTTSGTGSEATHFGVVYINGQKFSLAHRFMLPDFVIIDPELTYNTGSYQSAVSGLDALCQGVESFWSVHSTEQSRGFASKAIMSILAALEDSVLTGSKTARQEMSYGAHYAGKAINITKTTAPHALSYTLTSRYGIPHGHAVALLLGKFFLINEANLEATADRRGPLFFSQIMEKLYAMFDCRDAAACAARWYRRMEVLGLETNLHRLGIEGEGDYGPIVDSANLERLTNHPVSLTPAILAGLFE